MTTKSSTQKQLIWLGAGAATSPAYDFKDYSKVALVEAREDACQALTNKFTNSHVKVIEALISAKQQTVAFHVYNMAVFSSMHEPTVLKEWFPGLKCIAQISMETLPISKLLQEIGLSDTVNELVIDLPDVSAEIIDELNSSNLAGKFQSICIIYPVEAVYSGMPAFERIKNALSESFFEISETDENDPDFTVYRFRFNAQIKQLSDLSNENDLLKKTISSMERQILKQESEAKLRTNSISEELTARVEEVEKSAEAKRKELESELTKVKHEADKRVREAEAITKERRNELTKSIQEADKQVNEAVTTIKKLESELTKAQHEAEKRIKEVEETSEAKVIELTRLAAAEKKSAEQSVNDLRQQLEAKKHTAELEKEKLEQELAGSMKDMKLLASEKSKLKDALQHRLEEQKSQLADLKTIEANLNRKVLQLEKEITFLKKQLLESGNSLDSFIYQCLMMFYGKAITYVDIGAFDGKVARSFFDSDIRIAEAILVEPNPKSCDLLHANLESGAKLPKKLNIQNVAVSSKEGPLRLYDNNSMSRIISSTSEELPDSVFEVPTMTLADICSFCSEGQVSLLKIDVEGHEIEVLESGVQLFIDQQVDMIYIEAGLNPEGQQQIHYRLLDEFFLKYNYRLFRVFEQQYEWLEDSPFLRRWNMVYMSQKFADKHPYKVIKEIFELKRNLK